jgi:predicted RNA-binding Zn-ribbon protein involved in translation (DUF1610 family)
MLDGRIKGTNGENAVVLGEADSAPMACGACGVKIADGAIESALDSGGLTCACGHHVGARAVPEVLQKDGFWTALVGESTAGRAAPTTAPVSFHCPNCGGGLLVDGATRTPECRHCSKRAYLPDDLWRALRPTPHAEPFYLWVDPTWYARWARQRSKQLWRTFLTFALVWISLPLACLAVGWEDGLGVSIPAGWLPAWAAAFIVHSRQRPRRSRS